MVMVQSNGGEAERRARRFRSVSEKRRIVELRFEPGAADTSELQLRTSGGHARTDILLKHYAHVLDESADMAAETLSGQLSGQVSAAAAAQAGD